MKNQSKPQPKFNPHTSAMLTSLAEYLAEERAAGGLRYAADFHSNGDSLYVIDDETHAALFVLLEGLEAIRGPLLSYLDSEMIKEGCDAKERRRVTAELERLIRYWPPETFEA